MIAKITPIAPLSIPATLAYLADSLNPGCYIALQALARGQDANARLTIATYQAKIPIAAKHLAVAATVALRQMPNTGAIVMVAPPTRRPAVIAPYQDALIEEFDSRVVDLSASFTRVGNDAHAGDDATTAAEVARSLLYTPASHAPSKATLVVVDDIYARGRTSSAIAYKLLASGLELTSMLVACPLRIMQSTGGSYSRSDADKALEP